MSNTKVFPMGDSTLYIFEEEAIRFDRNGRIIRRKKTKSENPTGKKPTTKRPRKHSRRA